MHRVAVDRTRPEAVLAVPMSIDAGLCGHCQHAAIVRTDRGSVFYQCKRSFTDTRFKKYPTLPVFTCPGYESLRPAESTPPAAES